eukprot:s1_g1065.t1
MNNHAKKNLGSRQAKTPLPTRGFKKKERTQKLLIDAGSALLLDRGTEFAASDVSKMAEVSIGTFYNYFADADALVDAITEQQILEMGEAVAALPDGDPALRIAVVCSKVLQRAVEDEPWAHLVLRLVGRPAIYNQINGQLRSDLDAGYAQGCFETGPDDETLDQLMGLLVMTIRRFISGATKKGFVVSTVSTALRTLGVNDKDAQKLARNAAKF